MGIFQSYQPNINTLESAEDPEELLQLNEENYRAYNHQTSIPINNLSINMVNPTQSLPSRTALDNPLNDITALYHTDNVSEVIMSALNTDSDGEAFLSLLTHIIQFSPNLEEKKTICSHVNVNKNSIKVVPRSQTSQPIFDVEFTFDSTMPCVLKLLYGVQEVNRGTFIEYRNPWTHETCITPSYESLNLTSHPLTSAPHHSTPINPSTNKSEQGHLGLYPKFTFTPTPSDRVDNMTSNDRHNNLACFPADDLYHSLAPTHSDFYYTTKYPVTMLNKQFIEFYFPKGTGQRFRTSENQGLETSAYPANLIFMEKPSLSKNSPLDAPEDDTDDTGKSGVPIRDDKDQNDRKEKDQINPNDSKLVPPSSQPDSSHFSTSPIADPIPPLLTTPSYPAEIPLKPEYPIVNSSFGRVITPNSVDCSSSNPNKNSSPVDKICSIVIIIEPTVNQDEPMHASTLKATRQITKNRISSHITELALYRNQDGVFEVQTLRQTILINNVAYNLYDIYGIEVQPHGTTEKVLDGSYQSRKECVICMTEPRNTLVIPCRHMCLCFECAEMLRTKSIRCPICRGLVRLLLKVDVSKNNEDE